MKQVLIAILVFIIILLLASKAKYTKDQPTIITKIDTVYQQKTFTKYTKGIPYKVISKIQIDTITDTITILKDYSTVKVYTDTFSIDSSKFTIIDTISKNTIQGRQFKADIKEKTLVITNDIYHKDKNTLYLGFLGDLRHFDNKVGIGVGLTFKTAKNDLFTFGVSTNFYQVGYYKKIF